MPLLCRPYDMLRHLLLFGITFYPSAQARQLQPTFTQHPSGFRPLPQQAQQQMLRANMPVPQPLRLFAGVLQDPFSRGLSGISTDVGILSPLARPHTTCPRIFSAEAPAGRKRAKVALSSRNNPSNRCSGSIAFEPNSLTSYRAKKITRRAFSVYFSNIAFHHGRSGITLML